MVFIDRVHLFTDAGSRGNPGPGAVGIMICDSRNQILESCSECIGSATNNRAEYKALIKGLELCAKHTRLRVDCFLDSELVVKQMNQQYRLIDSQLRELFYEVKKREVAFKEVIYTHLERTNPYIKKVHHLVNEAFEGRGIYQAMP